MYAKIFRQIYDSSIAEDPQVRFTFMDMLVLSDRDGVVDMTHEAIARVTNVPLDWVKKSISVLESPDNRSRTADHSGARIARLDEHRDWGWVILNYDKFRDIANEEQRKEGTRERVRRHREKRAKHQQKHQCNAPVTPSNTLVTPTGTDAGVSSVTSGIGDTRGKGEDPNSYLPRIELVKPPPRTIPFRELQMLVNSLMARHDDDQWKPFEEQLLYEVSLRPKALQEFYEIKAFFDHSNRRYVSQTVRTLLEDWTGNLDKARRPADKPEKPEPESLISKMMRKHTEETARLCEEDL